MVLLTVAKHRCGPGSRGGDPSEPGEQAHQTVGSVAAGQRYAVRIGTPPPRAAPVNAAPPQAGRFTV